MKTKTKIYLAIPLAIIIFSILSFGLAYTTFYATYGVIKIYDYWKCPLQDDEIPTWNIDPKVIREWSKRQKIKAYKYNDQIPINVIKDEIVKQAKIYHNDPQFMLDLADCESTYNNLAENPISSAEGVYQFLYRTWRNTESGKKHISRFDYKANIKEANIKIANGEYFHWDECLN